MPPDLTSVASLPRGFESRVAPDGDREGPPKKERPGGQSQALSNRFAAVIQNDTRCARCGHAISSPRSLRVGYGRDCWPLVRDGVAA